MASNISFLRLSSIVALTVLVNCGPKLTPIPLVTPDPNSGISSPDIGVTPSYYPHLQNWKDPSNHGQAYQETIKNGQDPAKSLCMICHKFRQDSPACNTCHALYPHEYNWGDGSNHGAYVSKNGKDNCATQCHGTDLKSGLSGITCQSCHHPENWSAPENHGVFVLKNEKESCRKCHGEDLQGGVTGASCYNSSCHTAYPHPELWDQGANHGLFALSKGKDDCKKCHGDDLKGGISNISCVNSSCHIAYPHAADWSQPENHGLFALQKGKVECKKCHGEDLKGGTSNITCFNSNCHVSYPHAPEWNKPENHGLFALSKGKSDCQKCHGEDLKGGIANVTCYNSNCHTAYPHPEQWSTGESHGLFALAKGKEDCRKCHGEDLKGGISNVTCYNSNCHTVYPHTPQWSEGMNHGVFALSKGKIDCQKCHGEDLKGGISKISCATVGCHTIYPHTPDWNKPENHGLSAISSGKEDCRKCHGDDLKGGISNVTCYNSNCHSVYPHAPQWSEGKNHGVFALSKGKIDCQKCHGDDLQGGISKVSCSTANCHTTYPHLKDWNKPENHGSVVLSKGNQECKKCHGDDLKGGIANVSCFTCHAAYPHVASNWPTYQGHGLTILDTLKKDKSSCKPCHGQDFKGGISKISCYQCHTSYPHPTDFKKPEVHSPLAFGVGKESCASNYCHASDFKGNTPYVPGCVSCHEDYPHVAKNWVNGFDSMHVVSFTEKMNKPDTTACQSCHGVKYDRDTGGTKCTNCHPNGVTHTTTLSFKKIGQFFVPIYKKWGEGDRHGTYFSGKNTSVAVNSNCFNCHGSPINFNDTQTKQVLSNQTDCNACHFAYPHKAFEDQNQTYNWVPASNKNFGHVMYLINSPLFADEQGNQPVQMNDAFVIPAIENTCGGSTQGNCHFEGYRSKPSNSQSLLCGKYCH